MSDVPSELSGNHPLVPWLNRLRRAVLNRTPKSSPNTEVSAFSNGFTCRPVGAKGGSTAPAASGMNYRGIWLQSPPSPYMIGDVVIIQGVPVAGMYISVEDSNSNSPETGIGWVQLAPGNTVGAWL